MTSASASPSPVLSEEERIRVQRRTVPVLMAGQIVGSAAMGTAVTVGANVIQDLLGDETVWSGIATATVTLGTALLTQVLSARMRRSGRRPGMVSGYLAGAVGGVVAAVGVEQRLLWLFVVGLFIFGAGQSANLLARYAAVDLEVESRRSSTMSLVVFSSTFGAVFGPLLVPVLQSIGQDSFGLREYTGPWLFSAVLYLLAATNTAVRLRPDPLVLAGGTSAKPAGRHIVADFVRSMRLVGLNADTRLAVSAMVISHVTMVAVMTMTPVHLKLHGREGWSPVVISLHIAGMYAFAPLVGRYADRNPKPGVIWRGGVLLVGATALAAVAGHNDWLLYPALWLLGLGWNFGLLAGSGLLTGSVPPSDKVMVQGSADLLMSLCGGIAGLASGFIRRAVGYHILSTMAMILAGLLVVLAFTRERRDTLAQRTAAAA